MFIKSIQIKNYKLFSPEEFFEISDLSIPDGQNKGTGLTIFVGENGCGKSTLLDAFAMPYISYKTDSFSLPDINNPESKVEINIFTDEVYVYKGTMPNSDLKGKGFTTHSPLFIKQAMSNSNVKVKILTKTENSVSVANPELAVLPFVSANEVNFLAFKLATEEYHNELYEQLKLIKGETKRIKDFDNDFFATEKNEPKDSPWLGHQNEVSIHTFLRNQIHHQAENGKAEYDKIKSSIEKMRQYLAEINE